MKQFSKLFFAAAVAALGLASCAKEVAPVEPPKDNLVTVHFGATAGIEGATKATLTTEDELTFTSAWENGDELSVKYTNNNETEGATTSGIVSASWSTDHFEATMPEYKGWWDYNVVYPAPDADSKVDFGSTRTQKGNAYNSKYDLMKGSAIAEGAYAGKTADRKDIIFEMTRQTAIAYFHFTSALDEEVVSAKLSVEGNGAYLSTSDVQIGRDNSGNIDYAKGFVFKETEGAASKEINLTFTGEAPKSSDFKLWFNVLPTIYDKMTLTVETTNNTLTISRKATDMYEAGKLYKVVKKIPAEKWVKKGGETPTESTYTIEFNNTSKTVPSITETTKASTLVIAGVEYLEAQPFSGPINAYYGGDENNGLPLRIGKSKENGSITMALSKDGQINANMIIISAKQYSTGKTFAIGVNGSAKQKPGEDYTDLEFALDGSPLTSIKLDSDGYIYVKSITVVKGIDKRHNINVTEVEGGTLSASAIKAEEGTEITLTAEPQLGYEFNSDWSVVATDGTVINVVDNKFTMPAQDVTVSGTFSESTSTPTFASLAELVATGAPSTTARKVTVTLTDEEIIRFHTLKDGTVAGAIIKVGTQEVEIFCKGTPSDWKVGGTISGTLTNCDWKLCYSTWELCPADYSELTYTAPLTACATPVITIAEDGAVSINCETAGATIHYTVGNSPADPTEDNAVFSAATLTDGQTIKAIAFAEGYKPSAVASKKYTAGGAVESKTYTLQFGKEYNSEGKSSYNNTWSATCDGFTWDMTNWNNNNNGWSYVKAGPKGNRNANAKIETAAAMPEAISKISITIDEVKNGSITSIVLKSSSTSDFISGTTIETKSAVSAGTVEFTIPSAQNNLYYQLDFTLNNTTPNSNKGKNGVVTVSKVVYTNN